MQFILSLFYFFYFAIIGVYIVFLPKVLSMLGYSPSEIGIIFAAGPLVRFLLPFAFVKGLKLNNTTFNLATLIMLTSSISFYFCIDSFYGLLLSNIGLGMGLSVILPFVEVISLETMKKERYGKIRLFGSIGFIFVALILVKYLSSAQIALNYLLAFASLTAVMAFTIARTTSANPKGFEQQTNDISLLSDWQLWLGLTLMQVGFGPFYNFFTIYETDHGISLDMTIYLWTFGVVAEIIMLFYQARFLRKNLLLILKITTLATALRWLLLFLFPQNLVMLFLSQLLHALSFALFHSAAISYLFYLYKHKALAQQFFSGITYGLGGFVGALYAGYIYELFPRYLFLSSTFIALLASWFIYLWSRKTATNCKTKRDPESSSG